MDYQKELQKELWDESYNRKDNFLFHPNEEVIRFFSKYISKRIGLDTFNKKHNSNRPKVLDLGCGIGRHIIYSHQMETDAYGVDISSTAIEFAINWAKEEGMLNADKQIILSDSTQLPFDNSFFDFIISHGVLDSMPMENTISTLKEASRVLNPNGYFYLDLISGDDSSFPNGFSGEVIVDTEHEKGTVQLFFDSQLIMDTVEKYFHISDLHLIKRHNILSKTFSSRYHLVLQKKDVTV